MKNSRYYISKVLNKLYLCDTKMLPNDKVIFKTNPNFGTQTILLIEEDGLVFFVEGGRTYSHNLIKILGEVSPMAKWVKEGDEIEDSDFRKSPLPLCPKCGAMYNDGFCPEGEECEITKARIVYLIKCLTCKHFH